jgi:hypothetical protein
MPPDTLEFEEPIAVLLKEIAALSMMPQTPERQRSIDGLQSRIESVRADIYRHLTPWQRVLVARHPNRPLNRDQIMEQAHNRGWDVFDRSIDLRIMRLRRKIEKNPDKPELIKTVRNVGYVFVPAAER